MKTIEEVGSIDEDSEHDGKCDKHLGARGIDLRYRTSETQKQEKQQKTKERRVRLDTLTETKLQKWPLAWRCGFEHSTVMEDEDASIHEVGDAVNPEIAAPRPCYIFQVAVVGCLWETGGAAQIQGAGGG